jgi:hypothetical protein
VPAIDYDDVPGLVESGEHAGACERGDVEDILVEAVEGTAEFDEVADVVSLFFLVGVCLGRKEGCM